MGAKTSSQAGDGEAPSSSPGAAPPRNRTFSTSSSSDGVASAGTFASFLRALPAGIQVAASGDRQRARSLSSMSEGGGHHVVNGQQDHHRTAYDISESGETDSGSDEPHLLVDAANAAAGITPHLANVSLGRVYTHSLPSHIWTFDVADRFTFSKYFMGMIIGACVPDQPQTLEAFVHNHSGVLGIKCPICAKFLLTDDIECHLVMCLTKPRLNYNEDILSEDKGECVICLEDLSSGDVIARLPCLCIYHKGCIDRWFEKNRCCPEHPGD